MTKSIRPPHIPSSEITPEAVYLKRRQFMQGSAISLAALSFPFLSNSSFAANEYAALRFSKATAAMSDKGYFTDEALTPYADVSSYNNFYEFGTSKSDPSERAPGRLQVNPWNITVSGEAKNTGSFQLEDILKRFPLEERIYRLRCVEAWSMVIPWVGFSLADLIRWLEPNSKAKYVEFETLHDPRQMPAQKSLTGLINWPYREGLRLDEAMNDLSFMAVGLYGKSLPEQNGAPLRLVVPWKYGFKSIKSIVSIRFSETMPQTSWQTLAPNEYGFYANVNPAVSHPRWSQASERRLPQGLFDISRRKTELFNGYQEQVAHLYTGMNLSKYY
jgi:sulfoxide reductase catalytic subunit YedY